MCRLSVTLFLHLSLAIAVLPLQLLTELRQAPRLRAEAPGPLDTYLEKRRRKYNEREPSLVQYKQSEHRQPRRNERPLCGFVRGKRTLGSRDHWVPTDQHRLREPDPERKEIAG